jgi:hypothetical protein
MFIETFIVHRAVAFSGENIKMFYTSDTASLGISKWLPTYRRMWYITVGQFISW